LQKAKSGDASPTIQLPLSDSLGFLVREIHRMQSRLLQDELKGDNISGGGWYFLRVLWDEEGLTQREISLRIGVNEATTRTAIDRMEHEGLVVRAQDPGDRRKWIVRLTPRAKRLQPKLMKFAIDLNNRAMQDLSPEKRTDLITSLQSVYKELQSLSPGPDRRRRADGREDLS
jgi:DNA-binding MarR family transcriptional regulator